MLNDPHVPGLPEEDQQVIMHRWPIVYAWLSRWIPGNHAYHRNLDGNAGQVDLSAWFLDFEKTITNVEALQGEQPDTQAYRQGVRNWQSNYLFPLAQELELLPMVEATVGRNCCRRGYFDVPDAKNKKLVRPDVGHILPVVRQIRRDVPYRTNNDEEKSRLAQLQKRGVCRNLDAAERVDDAFHPEAIQQDAAGLARGILMAYFQYAALGLLKSSNRPYFEMLLLLERMKQDVDQDSVPVDDVWAVLRADIVALYRAAACIDKKLWNERLFHEPPDTSNRRHYQQKILSPAKQQQFVAAIQQQRHISGEEATQLLTTLVETGLSGLIDWRANTAAGHMQHNLEQRRIQRMFDYHLAVLDADDRRVIEITFQHIFAASRATGVSLPFAMLINDYPSSPRRKRIGRRFWFGWSAIMQRRQRRRRRKKTQHWYAGRKQRRSVYQPEPRNNDADRLVADFATRARLNEADARTILRDFFTSGLPGLLPKAARVSAVHRPLVSWLRLIKFGRLPGSVRWLQVMQQLNNYREQLGIAGTWTPQLARSVFNSIAVPAYWYGGQGDAVARVRQRATTNVMGMPRLHAAWLMVPFWMQIPGQTHQHQRWHGVLVFDRGSQLPMGVCFSRNPPTMREIQLALYEAIWHPLEPDWYLHGIPEQVQVPSDLAGEGIYDLEQAASWLLMSVNTDLQTPWRELKKVQQIRDDVRKQGGSVVRAAAGYAHELQTGQVAQIILRWLRTKYFPDHDGAPVPANIRKHGVAMPGIDTLAAGWLLPVTHEVETTRDGVWFQGALYASPAFHINPGQRLPCRTYPFYVPITAESDVSMVVDAGIFVETGEAENRRLVYCTRKS